MPRGGVRKGAGRPVGSGKFGEPTRLVRIPVSHALQDFRLPFYHGAVSAGFPSPADGEVEDKLDLNELLVKHPTATFFVRVAGSSMIQAGIFHGDILIVDRSLEPIHGRIVVAAVDGELTVKRLHRDGKKLQLLAENEAYAPIDISENSDLHIWCVVTNVIHAV
jgi:DNA polymerase V